MGGVRENIILGNLRPVLGKLVSSSLDQKKNDPLFQKNYYSKKKKNRERGLRIWNFHEYWGDSMWKFQGLMKNDVEFSGVIKKKTWVFTGVLALDLKTSKRYNINFSKFQGWSFVLPGISRGKLRNLKNPGFFNRVCSQTPSHPCFFSGIVLSVFTKH